MTHAESLPPREGAEGRSSTQPADPSRIPLLVLSFDKYEDLWDPFFSFFWKHWPDCPFKVYLGTNSKTYDDPRVTSLHSGPEVTWATRVLRLVEQLDSEYVLLFLEDFLIEERVDSAEVLRLARVALDNELGCLRLAPNPPPSRPVYGHEDLGWILPGDPYRMSSQVSIWHVDTLRAVLKPEYSIWDFEYTGSLKGPVPSRPMWARYQPAIRYQHCVERGMWLPWGLRVCEQAGIPVDLAARPAMRGTGLLERWITVLRGTVFRLLPGSVRRHRWEGIAAREGERRTKLTIPSAPATRP
jgi:hypothetical protein